MAGEGCLGGVLHRRVEAEPDVGAVERSPSRTAGCRACALEVTTVTPGVPASTESYCALEAADPGVVARDIPALALLHELGADRAVGAEQRLAERARARQRLLPRRDR